MTNGPAWERLIGEEFGDGIMSAIHFGQLRDEVAEHVARGRNTVRQEGQAAKVH